MRRLFARERRRGLPPMGPESRPVHRLVVSSSSKHREQIRLHQVVDGGFGSRVSVHRTWPLSDLRKIDGLGRSVAESTHFALYFSSSARALAWRTENPPARAVFLWALLQTCVSRLSRAPPVINLRLLDLQTTAENAEPISEMPAADGREEPQSSGTFKDSMRLASSLGELGGHRSADFPRPATPMSDSSINRPGSPHPVSATRVVPSAPAESQVVLGKNAGHGRNISDEQDDGVLESGDCNSQSGESVDRASKGREKGPRELSKTQRVKRTLSEPKASALYIDGEDESDLESSDERSQKADTITPGQGDVDPNMKDLNIDERAFLAAAKRLGGKRSFEMKRIDQLDRFSSFGSDPKARLFQNRLKMSEANTRKVVAERKMLQERKLFMLSGEEQNDLAFALDMFCEERKDETLQDFGAWVSSRIQSLEVENISDLVSVEKKMVSNCSSREHVSEYKHLNLLWNKTGDEACSYDALVESMTRAQPWLEKCQTLLAPYAKLAEDINNGVNLLETQRRNALDLDSLLTELIDALSFEYSEKSLLDGIGTFDPSFNVSELDTDDFQSAVEIISSKVESLERLSALSDMTAMKEVEKLLSQRQKEASNLLLPVLRDYLDKIYQACSSLDLKKRFCPDKFTSKDFSNRKDFAVNVRRLSSFGTAATQVVVDHYVLHSSEWIAETVRILNRESRTFSPGRSGTLSSGRRDITRELTAMNECFAENMFCTCIIEGSRACALFRPACEYGRTSENMTLSCLLRRQVQDDVIFRDFMTEVSKTDPVLVACVHQHASQVFERFADSLKGFDDGSSVLVLGSVSSLITKSSKAKDAFACWIAAEQARCFPLSGEPELTNDREIQNQLQSISPEAVAARKKQLSHSITEILSNFIDVCRCVALQCRSVTESHVKATLSSLEHKRDFSTELERNEFFSCVSMAVDLGCELGSPGVLENSRHSSPSSEVAKSTCERLISSAMKSVQISIQGCSESISDKVKLQNYGYIAAKLAECSTPDFLLPLSHLAARVRKHVVQRWLERQTFSSLDGILRLDTSRLPNLQSQLQSVVVELNVVSAVADIRKAVKHALESASETGAKEMLYRDTITAVKVRMEDFLKLAKREQVNIDTWAKLNSFSKQLQDALRVAVT